MKESIRAEFEALLKRRDELKKEGVGLEREIFELKKVYPPLSESEKKQLAEAERVLAESDKKMLHAEAKLVEIEKIL